MDEVEWSVNLLEQATKEFLSLPSELRVRLLRLLDMIEEVGLFGIPSKRKKHLKGEIWELRVNAIEGTARALYCTQNKNVWILVVFVKKTEQISPRIIDLAEKRRKEINNEKIG